MRTFDEEIARRLQEAADSGELQGAKGYGKPTPEDSAWDATPEALRMPMKILKDAGAAPPEIAMFHERAQLKQQSNLPQTLASARGAASTSGARGNDRFVLRPCASMQVYERRWFCQFSCAPMQTDA
jgi:hypothetical protein